MCPLINLIVYVRATQGPERHRPRAGAHFAESVDRTANSPYSVMVPLAAVTLIVKLVQILLKVKMEIKKKEN